jgi:hypothetical protein
VVKPAFECGVANFTFDPETQENPYYFIYSRKYTYVSQVDLMDGIFTESLELTKTDSN